MADSFSLRAALAPVWRGDAYYAKREGGPPAEHDPDGRVRSMHSDEEARRWAAERSDILAWLPYGCTVYDLGCGDGKLKHVRPDLRVTGWDPDYAAGEVARKRGCWWAQTIGNSDDEPFERGPFDALWCCHVVEHMADPLTDLAAGIAAVRPGGLVIVETPDFGSPVALEWGERFRLLHDPTHISLFTAESLMRMLRALNVEILEVAFPGYFGTPLERRCHELRRHTTLHEDGSTSQALVSPPAPGNVVAVRGRKR